MTMKALYWLAERDDLGKWAGEDGVPLASIASILDGLPEEQKAQLVTGELVLIKGISVCVRSKTVLDIGKAP